ncbi:putative quinol monooxygenase [Allostreptomyces psammosilenae]|uniref:Quinol monooxygenase YgiN n=1 Tax=Allostreptomyces psammosilenae TaxID=1892865 RepID=A0A853A9B1_9ACTN|nr:putative quinol monooxygenase [Allostreptomyces psammosilenae]NYI07002.1 quinol monooxygenase YgiN [Allostreptomyces psammosilenae]
MRPVTVVLLLRARPGSEDRLRTALEGMIEPSLDEPGCLAYQPYVDPNRPDRMAVYEEWRDEEALREHWRTPYFRHVAAVLPGILAEPMVLRRLVPADEGG